jgi:carbon storage regulator
MALILTRRPGETIVVKTPSGEIVEFTVVGTSGPQVRLAIDAPKHTSIDRREIYERKQREKAHG